MQYSTKFTKELSRLRLDAKSKALVELITIGYRPEDAFIVLDLNRETFSDKWNRDQLDMIMAQDAFQKYARRFERKMQLLLTDEELEKEDEEERRKRKAMTKEEVLEELLGMVATLKKDDPRRVDILMKYADLQQMKKEETKEEDKFVHFYLPVQCYSCSLYAAAQKKRGKKKEETA